MRNVDNIKQETDILHLIRKKTIGNDIGHKSHDFVGT